MRVFFQSVRNITHITSKFMWERSRLLGNQLTQTTVGQNFWRGLLIGFAIVIWLQQIILNWGLSFPVMLSIIACSVIGLTLGSLIQSQWNLQNNSIKPLLLFLLGAIIIGQAPAISFGRNFLASLPGGWMANPLTATFSLSLVLVFVLSIPIGIVTCLFRNHSDNASAQLFGISSGILLISVVLSPVIGMPLLVLATTLICVATAALGWWSENQNQNTSSNRKLKPPSQIQMFDLLIVLLAGSLLGLLPRYIAQLMPTANFVTFTEIAGIVLGLAISQTAWIRNQNFSRTLLCLCLALFSSGLILSFPQWVEASLWSITTFSSLTILISMRLILVVGIMATISFLVGTLFSQKKSQWSNRHFLLLISLASAGFFVTNSILVLSLTVGSLLAMLSLAFFTATIGTAWIDSAWPQQKITRIATAFCCVMITSSTFLTHRYNTQLAAQLLFSTRVFLAYKTNLPRKFLTHMNDSRHLSTVEGEFGTLTAWNYRAAQLQIRQNGIPKGIASRDPFIGPQFSAEMMHSILPLVIHNSANNVLILGYGAGTPLRTTLHFPVRNVTCMEADSGILKLASQNPANINGINTLKDDRVEIIHADPSIGITSLSKKYDVILSTPDHSALQHASYSLTKEFYSDIAQKLSANGIFSQRFSSSDYGEQPIRSLAATLRSAFPHVMMFDVASGELVFIASKSPIKKTMTGIIDRAKAPQVREMMAELGWDWTVLMNIAMYDENAINLLIAKNKKTLAPTINSTQTGYLTTTCPLEVIQGNKYWTEPIRKILADNRSRLLQKLKGIEQEQIDEISTRLKDVWARHQIINDYADTPWAYRKIMKERLTKTPRSKILPVKGEGLKRVMHPDDKARVRYLETLGKALRASPPTEKHLLSIEKFYEPYDPLVSEFLHTELARLNTRLSPPNYKAELRHRMHCINFGPLDDRSVRDITRCLEILTKHTDAVPTPQQRWDYTNSLLGSLQQRWEARRRNPSILPDIEKTDVGLSIIASTSGCDLLKNVGQKINLSSNEVELRCKLLERKLLNPLRSHRAKLNIRNKAEKRKRMNDQLQKKMKELTNKKS